MAVPSVDLYNTFRSVNVSLLSLNNGFNPQTRLDSTGIEGRTVGSSVLQHSVTTTILFNHLIRLLSKVVAPQGLSVRGQEGTR